MAYIKFFRAGEAQITIGDNEAKPVELLASPTGGLSIIPFARQSVSIPASVAVQALTATTGAFTGNASVGGTVTAKALQATASPGFLTSGAGVEIGYVGGRGAIEGFDRDTLTYLPLDHFAFDYRWHGGAVAAEWGRMIAGVLAWGGTNVINAGAGDVVVTKGRAIRFGNTAGTNTLIGLSQDNLGIGDGIFLGETGAMLYIRSSDFGLVSLRVTLGADNSESPGYRNVRVPNA